MSSMERDNIRGLKVSLIILSLMTIMIGVSCLSSPILYTILVVILLYDYFVLIGGTLNWLNHKIDDDFLGTGLYRRILAADAKLLLFTSMIVMWISYWAYMVDYSELQPCILTLGMGEYLARMWDGSLGVRIPFILHDAHDHYIPISVLVSIIKLLMLGQIIHSIHHLILNERIAGMRTSAYPPLTNLISRAMKWAREDM